MKKTDELIKKHKWIAFKVKFGYFLEALGSIKDYSIGDIVLYNNKKCRIIDKGSPFFWDLLEINTSILFPEKCQSLFSSANFFKNLLNRFSSHYKWRKCYWFDIHLRQEIVKSIEKHSF